jgi:hypothetical protein
MPLYTTLQIKELEEIKIDTIQFILMSRLELVKFGQMNKAKKDQRISSSDICFNK